MCLARLAAVPVVVFSTEPSAKSEAARFKAVAVIGKPAGPDALLSAVKQRLRRPDCTS